MDVHPKSQMHGQGSPSKLEFAHIDLWRCSRLSGGNTKARTFVSFVQEI